MGEEENGKIRRNGIRGESREEKIWEKRIKGKLGEIGEGEKRRR